MKQRLQWEHTITCVELVHGRQRPGHMVEGANNYLIRVLRFPEVTPFLSWAEVLCPARATAYDGQTALSLRNRMYDIMGVCQLRADVAVLPRLTKIWRGTHKRHMGRVCCDTLNAITNCEVCVANPDSSVNLHDSPCRAKFCSSTHKLLRKSHLNIKGALMFLRTCTLRYTHTASTHEQGHWSPNGGMAHESGQRIAG